MLSAARREVRVGILIGSVVAICVGCVPGYQVTSGGEIATFTGRLVAGHAEFQGETFDCNWLVGSGRRVSVIYPGGWDERFAPLRLIDASGQVFAVEGDVIRITYVTGGIGESVCGPDVLAAESVERVGAAPTAWPSAT
jgi:hypothetical protein